jgi:hypothetical protein
MPLLPPGVRRRPRDKTMAAPRRLSTINGHPVHEAFGPGPMEAVEDFLEVG